MMQYFKSRENVLLILILFFLAGLYLPVFHFPWLTVVNIIAISLLLLYALWYSPVKDKWQMLKKRKYLLGMCLFFCIVVSSVFLSDNLSRGFRYLDPRLPLFFFPLTIGTLRLTKAYRDKVLLGFAFITTLVCMLCLGYSIIFQSHFFAKPEFLYNDSLTNLIGQQSIYTSLLVNLSIFTFVYFLLFKQNSFKLLFIICTLFLFVVSFLLASRIMMGFLYAVSIGFCFYYMLQKKQYLLGTGLLLAFLAGIVLAVQFFPKTFNRFRELDYTNFDYEQVGKESHYNMAVTEGQWNGANFRRAAWQCGWELFKQHPLIGVNIGDKKDDLFELYRAKNFQFALQTEKNVHNNYLDVLYSMGLLGFTAFLLAWLVLPLRAAWKKRDGLALLTILTFAAAWITEIYFDRSLGGMLTGFFIPFVLAATDAEESA